MGFDYSDGIGIEIENYLSYSCSILDVESEKLVLACVVWLNRQEQAVWSLSIIRLLVVG